MCMCISTTSSYMHALIDDLAGAKVAEQSTSGLGRFLECWKCNIFYDTCIRTLPDIDVLTLGHCVPLGVVRIYQESTLACVIT